MPTWLGIDIGSAAVKVAVVRATYRKTAVVALASADIEPAEGRPADPAAGGPVEEALKRAAADALSRARGGADGDAASAGEGVGGG